jgi:hypothetical protein
MVLLDAQRLFDERNRDGAATPALERLPETAMGLPRLQVVSADRRLAGRLEQALPDAFVARVGLRDAGSSQPGEGVPAVLLDLRGGGVATDAIAALRRTRPHCAVIALVDQGVPLIEVYQAGAVAAVPAEVPVLAACFRSIVQNRSDLGGRAREGILKLRRVVGDMRSGLISTTVSLTLMNIVSESAERAVLFLVRRDGLKVLGAFGNDAAGNPLAMRARGMALPVSGSGTLEDCFRDGQVRALPFEEARLPKSLAAIIGRPQSGHCAVFPVIGGQRVIALVYADNGSSDRAIGELDILELAASQAGLAFENELFRRKQPH